MNTIEIAGHKVEFEQVGEHLVLRNVHSGVEFLMDRWVEKVACSEAHVYKRDLRYRATKFGRGSYEISQAETGVLKGVWPIAVMEYTFPMKNEIHLVFDVRVVDEDRRKYSLTPAETAFLNDTYGQDGSE